MNEILANLKTGWAAALMMLGGGFSQLLDFVSMPGVMLLGSFLLTSVLIFTHTLNNFRSSKQLKLAENKALREQELHELNIQIKRAELEKIRGE